MTNIKRIKKEDAILTAIDFQEKLLPAMFAAEKTEAAAVKLTLGFKELGIPMLTEDEFLEMLK